MGCCEGCATTVVPRQGEVRLGTPSGGAGCAGIPSGGSQGTAATGASTPCSGQPSRTGTVRSTGCQAVKPELARLQYRDVTPEDYELLCLLDEDVSKRGRRTSEAYVTKLPRIRAAACGATQCQVCLAPVAPDEHVLQLPCKHSAFHPECITKWLTGYSGTCPLCFAPVEEPAILGKATLLPASRRACPCDVRAGSANCGAASGAREVTRSGNTDASFTGVVAGSSIAGRISV